VRVPPSDEDQIPAPRLSFVTGRDPSASGRQVGLQGRDERDLLMARPLLHYPTGDS
jgi:hypothetical protein